MSLFCQVCRGEIPVHRAQGKKARTCSATCQAEYRKRARNERSQKKCRLCGRRFRSRNHGLVLGEHGGRVLRLGAD